MTMTSNLCFPNNEMNLVVRIWSEREQAFCDSEHLLTSN